MKNKQKIITFLYKIFILGIIGSQIYVIAYEETNLFTLIFGFILVIYLAFRLYLLLRLSKDAKRMGVPLPEFLNTRCVNCFEKYDDCKCNKSKSNIS
jgi:Flp pilus assembly protein TadB